MNIINGTKVDADTARRFLSEIGDAVYVTLKNSSLSAGTVINAADRLSKKINFKDAYPLLAGLGVTRRAAELMITDVKRFLSREYLEAKLFRELGDDPFGEKVIEGNIIRNVPLGVLTHIAAGNAAGLPAYSVLEGLLTGNINILKLPGNDDGLSTALLDMLIETEPELAEYIYVFDLPSTDAEAIKSMLVVSDAVAVWGSDFAINGIRSLAPPWLRIIEWGHKLSFACVTGKGGTSDALEGIARDICETEQLLCSSPQCVFYEADDFEELKSFGLRLFGALEKVGASLPAQTPEPASQAGISSLLCLKSLEELIDNKKVLRGNGFSVIVDMEPSLCASPMYRNIWVKPMSGLFETLRRQKGYLQTAGVACAEDEFQSLSSLLFKCGVCRITPCGDMAGSYPGEPHDGRFALRRYLKTAVCKTT